MKKLSVAELVLVPVRTFRTEQVNAATVAEYAALMERGVEFPPLTIAEVGKAKQRVMVGGMHRLAAAVKAKLTELPVNLVVCAAAIDAEVLAYTDNGSHGLRLTAEENRKALLAILQTPTFAKLSHAAAAKRLGVSDMSVKRYRDAVGEKSPKVAQSGHKAKKGAIEKGIQVDKGGKVEAVPVKGKATAWHIHEGGSWSGGGVDQIVEAITTRVTEGIGRKSVKSWNERCDYLRSIAAQLTAWADANSAKE
jgi:hypothetical protein